MAGLIGGRAAEGFLGGRAASLGTEKGSERFLGSDPQQILISAAELEEIADPGGTDLALEDRPRDAREAGALRATDAAAGGVGQVEGPLAGGVGVEAARAAVDRPGQMAGRALRV